MRKLLWMSLLLVAAGCSQGFEGEVDAGTTVDAGSTDGGSESAWQHTVLDPDAAGDGQLAMAISGERVGVAYFARVGDACELRYVEEGGQPEVIATVENTFGVSLAYDSKGDPIVAWLGGEAFGMFWTESDLAVATRSGGTWTTEVVVRTGDQAVSGIPTSDLGDVVGLWPAIAVGPDDRLFVAYRDVHFGQFGVQDYQHSDLELAEGRPGNWTLSVPAPGGNSTVGFGAMNSIVLVEDEPAIVFTAQPGSATDNPKDVYFLRRSGGTWSHPTQIFTSGDTRFGPSFAWAEGLGFAVAVEDAGKGILSYLESADGETWRTPDPVHGSGTGGWYPTLAIDPELKEPAIAYYNCSVRGGAQTCPAAEDELVLAQRRFDQWIKQTVDAEGGWSPKLAFAGPRAVVVYKDVERKTLRMAKQR